MLSKSTIKLFNLLFVITTKAKCIPFTYNPKHPATKLTYLESTKKSQILTSHFSNIVEFCIIMANYIASRSSEYGIQHQAILLIHVIPLMVGFVLKLVIASLRPEIVDITNTLFAVNDGIVTKLQLQQSMYHFEDASFVKRSLINECIYKLRAKIKSLFTTEVLLELFCQQFFVVTIGTPLPLFLYWLKSDCSENLYYFYIGPGLVGRVAWAIIGAIAAFNAAARICFIVFLLFGSQCLLLIWTKLALKSLTEAVRTTSTEGLKMFQSIQIFGIILEKFASSLVLPLLLFGSMLVLIVITSSVILFHKHIWHFLLLLLVGAVIIVSAGIMLGLEIPRHITEITSEMLYYMKYSQKNTKVRKSQLNAIRPLYTRFSFLFTTTAGTVLIVFKIITDNVVSIVVSYRS